MRKFAVASVLTASLAAPYLVAVQQAVAAAGKDLAPLVLKLPSPTAKGNDTLLHIN